MQADRGSAQSDLVVADLRNSDDAREFLDGSRRSGVELKIAADSLIDFRFEKAHTAQPSATGQSRGLVTSGAHRMNKALLALHGLRFNPFSMEYGHPLALVACLEHLQRSAGKREPDDGKAENRAR